MRKTPVTRDGEHPGDGCQEGGPERSGQATQSHPKPHQSHIKATQSHTEPPQSHLIANRKPPQSHTKATPKPPSSHLQANCLGGGCAARPVVGRGVLTVPRASEDVRNVRVWEICHGPLRTASPHLPTNARPIGATRP